MSEPKTVWVVEEGSYSDYRVAGVFLSQENARLIADAINARGSGEATVDEWPLDPAVSELRHGLAPYFVLMQEDGTVERVDKQEVSSCELAGAVRMWRRSQTPVYKGKGVKDVLQASGRRTKPMPSRSRMSTAPD